MKKVIAKILAYILKNVAKGIKNLVNNSINKNSAKVTIVKKDGSFVKKNINNGIFSNKNVKLENQLGKLKNGQNMLIEHKGHTINLNNKSSGKEVSAFMKLSTMNPNTIKKQEFSLKEKFSQKLNSYFGSNDAKLTLKDSNNNNYDLTKSSLSLNQLKNNLIGNSKELKPGEVLKVERNGKSLNITNNTPTKDIKMFLNNSYKTFDFENKPKVKETLLAVGTTAAISKDKLMDKKEEVKVSVEKNNLKNEIIISNPKVLQNKEINQAILNYDKNGTISVTINDKSKVFDKETDFNKIKDFIDKNVNQTKKIPSDIYKDIQNVIDNKSDISTLNKYKKEDIIKVLDERQNTNANHISILKDNPQIIDGSNKNEINKIVENKMNNFNKENNKIEELKKVFDTKNVTLVKENDLKKEQKQESPNRDKIVNFFKDHGDTVAASLVALLGARALTENKLAIVIATLSTAYIQQKYFDTKGFDFSNLANKERMESGLTTFKELTKNNSIKPIDLKPDNWIKVDKSTAMHYDKANTPIIREGKDFYVGLKLDNLDPKSLDKHLNKITESTLDKVKDLSNKMSQNIESSKEISQKTSNQIELG